MLDPAIFLNFQLQGGFVIVQLELAESPVDALGRSVLAKTRIHGKNLYLTLRAGLDDRETSVTLYHEILEAMTVAVSDPPVSVLEFNEGDFERAGYEVHDRFGVATPANLNRMLQMYGFRGE